MLRACFVILFLFVTANAQTTDHKLRIGIPQILQLAVQASQGSSIQETLSVDVLEEQIRITPSATELKVLANSSWQLSARAVLMPKALESMQLTLISRNHSFPLQTYNQLFLSGSKTEAWQTHTIDYHLQRPSFELGSYQVVIRYSLTQP